MREGRIKMQFLRIKDLQNRYGISRQTVYNYENQGVIPKSFKIGNFRVWDAQQVENFDEKRIKEAI